MEYSFNSDKHIFKATESSLNSDKHIFKAADFAPPER